MASLSGSASDPETCRLCGSARVALVGPIFHPRPAKVAGVPLPIDGWPFALLRCLDCSYRFKTPRIPAEMLLRCYSAASPDHWALAEDPRTRRADEIEALAERSAANRRIVDIGCFNGAILACFAGSWDKHGIEPGARPAETARGRGVRIIGESVATVADEHRGRYGVALALDLVEHLEDPATFLRSARELLAPHGALIVLTGDTDATTWRLTGSSYWYCSNPEHVGFFNRDAIARAAAASGFEVASCQETSHSRLSPPRRAVEAAKNLSWLAARGLGAGFLPVIGRLIRHHRGPHWLSARDHLLCALRRVETEAPE